MASVEVVCDAVCSFGFISIPLLSQSYSISTRGVYLGEVVSRLPQAYRNGWKALQEP